MKRLETRAYIDQINDEQSRTITGRAIVFDSPSRVLMNSKGKPYTEYVRSSAITQELIDNSDIIFNYNHDNTRMLARSIQGKGTLNVELRDDGVYFSFEAPDTELGNEILWHLRHGNLFDCSFCFSIGDEQKDINWWRDENGLNAEIVNIVGLYDMTVCAIGAYSDTDVSARNAELRDFDLEAIERSLDEAEPQQIVSEEVKEVIEAEVNEEAEQRNDETAKNESFYIKYNDRLKNILNKI